MFAECFVESIPQLHLTLILTLITGIGGDFNVRTVEDLVLFCLSFGTSLVSASLGMSRLLLNGPSKLMKKSESCGGYNQWGFGLLNLSIMNGIISKTAWISVELYIRLELELLVPSAMIWVSTSFIPQCLLVRKCSV